LGFEIAFPFLPGNSRYPFVEVNGLAGVEQKGTRQNERGKKREINFFGLE
jgi:hypothetical protein